MSTFDGSLEKITQCNICSILIPNSMLVQHNNDHNVHVGYSVEVCKFCNNSMTTNNVESILEHMIYDHKMKSHCPICEEVLEKMDDLYYHLQDTMQFVYHCQVPDCVMMSDKKIELIKHQKTHALTKQNRLIFKKKSKCNEGSYFTEVTFYCKYGDRNERRQNARKIQEMAFTISPTCPKTGSIVNDGEGENMYQKQRVPVKHRLPYTPPQPTKRFKMSANEREIKPYPTGKLSLKTGLNKIHKNSELADQKTLVYFTYSEKVLNKFLDVCVPEINEDFHSKLGTLKQFPMVVSVEDNMRKFTCDTCGYSSFHSYTDIKRHIIRHHCEVKNKSIPLIMKVSKCNSDYSLVADSELIRLLNHDISLNNFNTNSLLSNSDDEASGLVEIIENKEKAKINQPQSAKSFYNFNFSQRVLRKYLKATKSNAIDELLTKLKPLTKFQMSIHIDGNVKKYTCETCQYYSVHSHTDIKRHIFRNHCDVSCKNMPAVLKVSKNNSEMKLLSDSEQITQINNEISLNSLDENTLLSDSDCESDENCNQSTFTKSFNKSALRMIGEIDCGYSEKILQSLCHLEKCPQNFSFLRKKMDVYASHTVQIHQRNNRQLFTCSGCSWYSREKISDVMKHIMNHHAELEAQSKEIRKLAETCCKTDKDNRLLSDQEISDKGWKGRKILV